MLSGMAFLYFHIMQLYVSDSVVGCDTYGYLSMAESMHDKGFLNSYIEDRLISEIYSNLRGIASDEDLKYILAPHSYYICDFGKGRLCCQYPPGFPLLISFSLNFLTRSQIFYLLPAVSFLFLLYFFHFVNNRFGEAVSILSVFLLAFLPLFLSNTTSLMSDVPSLILIFLSITLLYFQKRGIDAFVSGALFGFSVMVKYTNAISIIPIAYIFWVKFNERNGKRKIILRAIQFSFAAFLFGVLPLMAYQYSLFGNLFTVTYPDSYMEDLISPLHIAQTFPYYVSNMLFQFGSFGWVMISLGAYIGMKKPKLKGFSSISLITIVSFFLCFCFIGGLAVDDRYMLVTFPFLSIFYGIGGKACIESLGKRMRKDRFKILRAAFITFLLFYMCTYSFLSENILYTGLYSAFSGHDVYFGGPRNVESYMSEVTDLIPNPKNSIILSEENSGPLRLYENMTSYRPTWGTYDSLNTVVSYLLNKNYDVYLLKDWDDDGENVFYRLSEDYILEQIGEDLYRINLAS